MATIRKKILIFSCVALIGIAISVSLLMISFNQTHFKAICDLLIYLFVLVTGIFIIALAREYRNLKISELIIENQILHIKSAYSVIVNHGKTSSSDKYSMDIFISNFGILLDSKIIKFNQGSSQLKEVEIGKDFISFIYGTQKQILKTCLLRMNLDDHELAYIVEKFHFETGVIPVIITDTC